MRNKRNNNKRTKKQECLQCDPSCLNLKRQKFAKSFFSTINSNNASNNCSNNCFLFEKCAREGGCQGAARRGTSLLFSPGGHFFSMIFMTLFFSQKNAKVFKKMTNNSHKIQLKSNLGLIFCDFLYIIFLNDPTAFLLYFTASHCSQLQEKHIKSTLEKSHVFTTTF